MNKFLHLPRVKTLETDVMLLSVNILLLAILISNKLSILHVKSSR